jgi:ketosteroid isomerase-like protein
MTFLGKTALAISLLGMALVNHAALASDDSAGAFVARFHEALFSEDMETVSASFAVDAVIFEGGKREPSLAGYLEHHLGPELPMLAGLTREVQVEDLVEVGDVAWYGVQAQLHGMSGERELSITHGTTIVMLRGEDGWKIMQIHFSNRRNKPAAAEPDE